MLLALKQHLLWGLLGSSIVISSSLATVYLSGGNRLNFSDAANRAPVAALNSLDAVNYCQAEAEEKFEGQLLYSNADWHSTRFEPTRNEFMVLLNGAVGTHSHNEKVNIYCYVSPADREVSYFRAYDSNNQSMLTSGINLEVLKSFSR